MKYHRTVATIVLALSVFGTTFSFPKEAHTQEPVAVAASENKDIKDDQAARFKKFTEMLSGKKLVGSFTVDGVSLDQLRKEEYTIQAVQKMPDGDYWLITARIKYGNNDVVFPVPIEVKWSGDTPIMTLDDLKIPGLGTFSGRIVFHAGKYAGTWGHDDKGGHMFGHIEAIEKKDSQPATPGEPK